MPVARLSSGDGAISASGFQLLLHRPIPAAIENQTSSKGLRENDGWIKPDYNYTRGYAAMEAKGKRRHVFISHHHADDAEVSKLSDLLAKRGYDIRNSSIRAKPANQRRLDQGVVKDETIRRLLRISTVRL
jgi:hypothetical protein